MMEPNDSPDPFEFVDASSQTATGDETLNGGSEQQAVGRIQMLLAEKRTSLSVLRTGFGLLTLPMSLATLLIATSKLYHIESNLHYLIPLFALNTLLVILGIVLIQRGWRRIVLQDRMIVEIKRDHPRLRRYIIE